MTAIEDYFKAERSESVMFILVGLVAIGLSVYFLIKFDHPFYTGLAYPLILVALIQLTVGTTVYLRSPKDLQRVTSFVEQEEGKIESAEIPRMKEVMKNFAYYRYFEIFLLVVGIILTLVFTKENIWMGVGIGLTAQSVFMLVLDYFAEQRGKVYLEFLQQL